MGWLKTFKLALQLRKFIPLLLDILPELWDVLQALGRAGRDGKALLDDGAKPEEWRAAGRSLYNIAEEAQDVIRRTPAFWELYNTLKQ